MAANVPWFTPAKCTATVTTQCFQQPGFFNGGQPEFGNLGWNVLRGPGFWNLDGSLFREFQITERHKLQFRAECFSCINTPQWSNPDTGFNNATFGFINGAGGARSMQLGAKVLF